jgi:hypothetical protein
MMNWTHNSEADVRTLVQSKLGCDSLLGWFSNFQ